MELAIPLVALSGLYVMNKQKPPSSNKETFVSQDLLPNTNLPDRNYPPDSAIRSAEWDRTSHLSANNRFDAPTNGVYTDKYFNPAIATAQKVTEDTSRKSMGGSDLKVNSAPKNSYTSLTGEQVELDYFQHNNMTPFFGSHVRSPLTGANSAESRLDTMTGSGSQYISKSEQSPLFAPDTNVNWAYGMPNQTDFMRSRVNPSMRMANVNPFKEEKVGPGLGLGYTSEGGGGYNSGMAMREAWMDRGVDELRVASKPKSSGHLLIGHEGPADSYIKTMSDINSMGVVEKNRPETSFELTSDRWFRTTGVEKGQTLHSIPIDRYVNRPETTAAYSGVAGQGSTKEKVHGEYMPTHRTDLGEVPLAVANANGRGYANDADYGIKSQKAYPNNRSENDQDNYYGIVSGTVGAVVAPLLDILRPSRRENAIGTLRPYQNPGSTVSQPYIFNPADRPAHTIRETTENSKFACQNNTTQFQRGAYEVTEYQETHTERQTTSVPYTGISSAGARTREARPYDAEYRQRNNDLKSSTVEQTAYMIKGNMSLLNGDINARAPSKEVANTRPAQPMMPYQSPDMANMGAGMTANGLYSGIQLDRTKPDILYGLKSNPYTIQRAF